MLFHLVTVWNGGDVTDESCNKIHCDNMQQIVGMHSMISLWLTQRRGLKCVFLPMI